MTSPEHLIQRAAIALGNMPRYEIISSAFSDDDDSEAVSKMLQDYDEGLTIAENALKAAATALGIRIQEN